MLPLERTTAGMLVAAAALLVVVMFAWEGHRGFSLYDEGFLWYGAQGVRRGEAPIRDFMAYDPGRYYWSAAFMQLAGNDGIMALRAAIAVFQTMGLFVAMRLVAPAFPSRRERIVFLAFAAIVFCAWMIPRHKLFDITISILLTGTLGLLIAAPVGRRWLVAGAYIGISAIFGRNHGMYGVVGLLGAASWLAFASIGWRAAARGLLLGGVGVASGYAPLVLWMVLVPGVASPFVESILFHFELGATNIPLPTPWPWAVPFDALATGEAARQVMVGMFFVALLAFPIVALGVSIAAHRKGKPVSPVVVASGVLGIPYAHYAFSRAEIYHLALGSFPLLIGTLALFSMMRPSGARWGAVLLLTLGTLFAVHPAHPGWHCRDAGPCVEVDVAGSTLRVDPGTAANVALLRAFAAELGADGQPLLIAPHWPGAYPLLERRSPVWEIYALVPRSPAFERREIDRLTRAGVSGVLILDAPLDGRDELRFRNTHPHLYAYVAANFERMPLTGGPDLQAYRARPARLPEATQADVASPRSARRASE